MAGDHWSVRKGEWTRERLEREAQAAADRARERKLLAQEIAAELAKKEATK